MEGGERLVSAPTPGLEVAEQPLAPDIFSPEEMEQPPLPDLMADMGDEEVTIAGMTAPLRVLGGACKHATDPNVPLQKKNDFIVKAYNASGQEISPKYEALFRETVQRLGLEVKFTVAESVEAYNERAAARRQARVEQQAKKTVGQPKELPKAAEREKTAEQTAGERLAKEAVAQTVMTEAKSEPTPEAPHQTPHVEEIRQPLVEEIRQSLQHEARATDTVQVPTGLAEQNIHAAEAEISHNTTERDIPERATTAHELPKPVLYDAVETPDAVAEPFFTQTQEAVTMQGESAISDSADDEPIAAGSAALALVANLRYAAREDESLRSLLEEFDTPSLEGDAANGQPVQEVPASELPVHTTEAAVEFNPADAAEAWGEELTKEPAEIYEDFTAELAELADTLFVEAFAEETEHGPDTENPAEMTFETQETPETPEASPAAPVVRAVAERLTELEPDAKAEAAEVMQNITGAIHGIRLLEARAAPEEQIAVVEARLEELCVQLFETIGLEYAEEDVMHFVAALLRPDFQPGLSEVAPGKQLDLTRVGTREAKRSENFGFVQDGSTLDKILGWLALTQESTKAALQAAA